MKRMLMATEMPHLKWPDEAKYIMLCHNCKRPYLFMKRVPEYGQIIYSDNFIHIDGSKVRPGSRPHICTCGVCGFNIEILHNVFEKRHWQLLYGNGKHESYGILNIGPLVEANHESV